MALTVQQQLDKLRAERYEEIAQMLCTCAGVPRQRLVQFTTTVVEGHAHKTALDVEWNPPLTDDEQKFFVSCLDAANRAVGGSPLLTHAEWLACKD